MIKTAVILAAGVGSRFGSHTLLKPKGFVCVGGKTMIERSIENLLDVGIEKIIVCTGHQASFYYDLTKKYSQIACCQSDRYLETNSMYSLYCVYDLIGDDDFLLLESDLIYECKALTVLIDSKFADAMLLCSFTKQQDGYYIFADINGIISGCTTDVGVRDKCAGELVGIHKLSNRTYKKMREWYGKQLQQQPKMGYEYAMVEMARQNCKIYALKIDNLYWYEIDDEADLLFAEKNVIQHISKYAFA